MTKIHTTASSQQSNIEAPVQSLKHRKDTGYLSDRHSYFSKYYQKNKEKIKVQKAKRYNESETVREYHRKKSNEWYHKNKVNAGGKQNRTIMQTEDGQRLYSIRHAAAALGVSITYFRDFIKKGIVPEASYKAPGRWRLYTKGQVQLLRRAASEYRQYTTHDRMQAVLFCFWETPEIAMKMIPDACLIKAIKQMEKTAKRADKKTIKLKMEY